MARPAAHADVFAAVAEPRRREILGLLAEAERPVGDIVDSLGLPQPQVSKHLRVLRDADLVSVRGEGRLRVYSLNGERLRPIHEWARRFERFWAHQLDRIRRRAEANAAQSPPRKPNDVNRDHPEESQP